MGRASGGSNTPYWIRNNILDLLRVMSMKSEQCLVLSKFI